MNTLLVLTIPAVFLTVTLVLLGARGSAREGSKCRLDLDDSAANALPEHIRLVPLGDQPHRSDSMARLADKLGEQGFEHAGVFAIDGIPDVTVRLLAHPAQSMYAALWDYSAVGTWYEFSTRYPGATKCTFTTLTGSGLESRPGHTIVRDPGAKLLDLYLRASAERPMGVFMPASAAQAVTDFEDDYAAWMRSRREQKRTQAA